MFLQELDLGVREPDGQALQGLWVYDVLPSFTMLDESLGNLFDGVTPDGEHDTIGSLEGKEGTEMETSQRRNAERLNDVLRDVLPG